jgi:hypothetical protein
MKLLTYVLTAVFLIGPGSTWLLSHEEQAAAVIIDGSKNPQLFPQWFIWELTFQRLSGDMTKRPIPLHRELGVTEDELKFVLDEVRSFQQIQQALAKQLRETRNAEIARGKRDDEVQDATHAVNLDYRFKVLESRQRIHERLSPESLIRLRAWIDQGIRGTKVRLRGRAVEFFKQPW